jgi:hypothetical protein
MAKHLAGIIPLANFDEKFKLPYHSCLLPIANNFTLIQKSVYECAMAGCATIWIVANEDMAPVIKHHIGEWVYDPVYFWDDYVDNKIAQRRTHIPIYYIPIHPKDRSKRDSYGWSALYGMHSAWWVSFRISKWVIPKKYFVSFPHSVYDYWSLREFRKQLSKTKRNFFFTHEGKTIKDNVPIPFTMRGEDFIQCRRHVNKITTKNHYPLSEGETWEDLRKRPLQERWSAKNFDLSTVFDKVKEEEAIYQDLDWFYDMSDWDGYRDYLGSGIKLSPPNWRLTKPHKLNKLCVDDEEE